MKKLFWSIFIWTISVHALPGQIADLYDDTKVCSIFIVMPPDSLEYLMANQVNTRYMKAKFYFSDGVWTDSVAEVGIRLRGNTSLWAQKKSFKISFNTFDPDEKYQGIRKINLRGSHNDPTMIREKLFYHVWNRFDMPPRRSAFVRFYINNEYRGLYTNMEEIDKLWLNDVFDDNDGNLYKCTWPANLAYLGTQQNAYKNLYNNPETRAYDLVTNESEDDYSGLVQFITALHQPVNAAFPDQLEDILHVESALKSYAIDVCTGNWDDYFYNKNNYYLYDNPASGRFEFFTFDTDNTFGVDWVGQNWVTRNALNWHAQNDPRPLASQLLAVPAYKDLFVRYLDTLTRFIVHPDSIFPLINTYKALIAPAAAEDYYRTLDYGYTLEDFNKGFDQTVDGHTPFGIKPFLLQRRTQTRAQIAGLVHTQAPPAPTGYRISPNPASTHIRVEYPAGPDPVLWTLRDYLGRQVAQWTSNAGPAWLELPAHLPAGAYVLHGPAGAQTLLIQTP